MVAARVILAAGGGYVLAALTTGLLSLTLPLARSEAVTTATLLSFLIMIGVAVFVFAARSLGRAALSMTAVGCILGGALWLAMRLSEVGSPT